MGQIRSSTGCYDPGHSLLDGAAVPHIGLGRQAGRAGAPRERRVEGRDPRLRREALHDRAPDAATAAGYESGAPHAPQKWWSAGRPVAPHAAHTVAGGPH